MTPNDATRYFGAHTVDNGGIHMAALRAAACGMTALQIFTAKPQFYNDKMSIRPERALKFRQTLAMTKVAPECVIVHAAYVLSVATPDDEKWARASGGLRKELERSSLIGAGGVCFHPGSAGDSERGESAKRIAKAMTDALEAVPGNTRLLVENTAGAGRTMGKMPEEIGTILSYIPTPLRPRAGYGLDTCHLISAGHDIVSSRASLTAVLDAFEDAAGEPPSFFHLNDSEGARGSNRDRHLLIGEGTIGIEPFGWLLADRRTEGIPLILETPQKNYEIADDDPSCDEYDARMIGLLESLV